MSKISPRFYKFLVIIYLNKFSVPFSLSSSGIHNAYNVSLMVSHRSPRFYSLLFLLFSFVVLRIMSKALSSTSQIPSAYPVFCRYFLFCFPFHFINCWWCLSITSRIAVWSSFMTSIILLNFSFGSCIFFLIMLNCLSLL